MSKARDLADFVAAGGQLADGVISVSEISDLTASAAELNTLDGITASTAELNYLDGVTSNIQTQLNTIDTDLLNDTTPQLGGNLDLNSNDVTGTGDISITGSVTATSFSGDGSSLTGIQAGVATYTASENISAGNAVVLNSSGELEKVFGAVASADSFDSAELVSLESSTIGEVNDDLGLLHIPNTDKAIWFANVSSDLVAYVISVSGTTPTKLAGPITLNNRIPTDFDFAFDTSTSDTFVIVFRDPANSDIGISQVCTFDDSTNSISTGAEFNISTEFGMTRSEENAVIYDESQNAFLYACKDISGDGHLGAATRSGTTLTFGTDLRHETSSAEANGLFYDASLSKSVLTYVRSGTLVAKLVSLSGTTVSVDDTATNTDVTWSGRSSRAEKIIGDGNGRFVAVYNSSSNSRAYMLKATSSAVTFEYQTEIKSPDGGIHQLENMSMAYHPFATTAGIVGAFVILSYNNTDSTGELSYIYEETGETGVDAVGLQRVFIGINDIRGQLGIAYIPTQSSLAFAGEWEGTNQAYAGAFALDANFTNSNKFIGFAEESISSGQSGSVTIIGGTNTQQSGLATGSLHYLTAGGALTTTETSLPIGIATSATSIQVSASAADYSDSPSALILIQEVTASNDASVILTGFSSTYDSYIIEAVDIYGGNSAQLRATVYTDGSEYTGPEYQSSVEKRSVTSTSLSITAYSNQTFWALTGDSLGSSSSNKMATTIRVYNIDSSAKLFTAQGIGHYGGPSNSEAIGANQSASGEMTGMKFFLSSGNIYGTFRLYGLTKG